MVESKMIVNWYGWNTTGNLSGYVQNTVLAERFDELMKPLKDLDIKTESNRVDEGDSVFFHTTSTIPRYKFSNYTEGKKIKRVIRTEKATCCVINMKALKQDITSHIGSRGVFYDLPQDWANNITPKNANNYRFNNSLRMNSTSMICSPRTYQTIEQACNIPSTSNFTKTEYYTSYSGLGKDLRNIILGLEDLNALIKDNVKFVDDNVLNRQMSEGANIVNEDNYDEFAQMLASTDPSTVQMGLELLANSDYVNSKFYISLLLNRNRSHLDAYTKKGVNLTNFFKYFGDIQWTNTRHMFLSSLRNSLRKSNTLDETKEKFIRSELLQYANDTLSGTGIKTDRIYFMDEKIEERSI